MMMYKSVKSFHVSCLTGRLFLIAILFALATDEVKAQQQADVSVRICGKSDSKIPLWEIEECPALTTDNKNFFIQGYTVKATYGNGKEERFQGDSGNLPEDMLARLNEIFDGNRALEIKLVFREIRVYDNASTLSVADYSITTFFE